MDIRTALIGAGRIGWSLEKDRKRYHPCSHAGAMATQPDLELAAICDPNPKLLNGLSRWWRKARPNQARRPSSWDSGEEYLDAIADGRAERPELLVIATPVESHERLATTAIRLGIGSLLIEKPITGDLAAAKRIQHLAKKHNCMITVNFERRYQPWYRLARSIVDKSLASPNQGDLKYGQLRSMRGRVLTGPIADDFGGPLLHDASHWLDLLVWYLGRPETLHAEVERDNRRSRHPEIEHTVHLHGRASGIPFSLESGGRRRYFEFALELDFERGRIVLGNGVADFFLSASSPHYSSFRTLKESKPAAGRLIESTNPWPELYRQIVAKSRRIKRHPMEVRHNESLDQAVIGMEIIDYCYRITKESAKQGNRWESQAHDYASRHTQ